MLQKVKQQAQYAGSYSQYSAQRESENINQGIWQKEQLLKFMVFSHFNSTILNSKLQRRTIKIFKEMSRFIATRNSSQCRSQNQKLIKKHKNLKRVLSAYEKQIGKSEFQEACLQHQNELKSMRQSRKRGRAVRIPNSVNVFTQTQFSSDSQQEDNKKVKLEQQVKPSQNYPSYSLNPFPPLPHKQPQH